MIHEYTIDGLTVRTGDMICTTDGTTKSVLGRLWQALGNLVPGEVDHIVLYVGPHGRCIEAGARGVLIFEVPEGRWDAERMSGQRWLLDTPIGVGDPLAGRELTPEEEARIRIGVAEYCLEQASKPYNFNFFNPDTESAFYCSQLIYKAYMKFGIDLSNGQPVQATLSTDAIIFPEELWRNARQIRYVSETNV